MAVMPTNLYGPGDNFHPENSHVLPALIRRFHEAKVSGAKEVVVWGTGSVRREFLHVDDMADACLFIMNMPQDDFQKELLSYPKPCFVNVGSGVDLSIRELAEIVAGVVGYEGEIVFDATRPEGTPRKLLDVGRLSEWLWTPKIEINDGIQDCYDWFQAFLPAHGRQ